MATAAKKEKRARPVPGAKPGEDLPTGAAPFMEDREEVPVYLAAEEVDVWEEVDVRATSRTPARIEELRGSIRENGVLQPVRADRNGGGRPRVFMGVTRTLATRGTGRKLPVLLGDYTEAQALALATVENIAREDLTALEEYRAYQRYLDATGDSQRRAAEVLLGDAKKQPTIANAVRLLRLPEPILQLIEDGLLLPSHARDLLLPFLGLREDLQGPRPSSKGFWKELPKKLRSYGSGNGGGAWSLQTVRSAVQSLGRELSRPLAPQWHSYPDKGTCYDVTKEHESCTCGAPKFDWSYAAAHVRCFDVTWWERAQEEKRKVAEQRKEAVAAKVREATAGSETGAPLKLAELRTRWSEGNCNILTETTQADPAVLAGTQIVYSPDYGSGWHPGAAAFVSVQPGKYRQAVAAFTRARDERAEELQAAAIAEDLQQIEGAKVGKPELALLMGSLGSGYGDGTGLKREHLVSTAARLGIKLPQYPNLSDLAALEPAQLERLALLLVRRWNRGDLRFTSVHVAQATQELVERNKPAWRELLRKPETTPAPEKPAGEGKGKGRRKATPGPGTSGGSAA